MDFFAIKNYTSSFVSSWNEDYIFNGESHTMCEIVFVKSGSVIVTEENTVYTLKENQMIIHAPMEFHCIRSAKNSSPIVYIMSFNIDGKLPKEITNGVFTLSLDEKEDFLYSFEKAGLVYEGNTSELDIIEANCRMTAFLIRLTKSKANSNAYISLSANLYHEITSFMKTNINKNFSTQEIANKMHISKSYLKYLFQKYAGVSPKQYDIHLKIKAANKMMEKGVPICEIADNLNFSSPNYFSTFYKKHTKISPSEYKSNSTMKK